VSSIAINIITCICTDKLFPQIVCRGKLQAEKKNEIKNKIEGLLIDKLCFISRNAFDSIFVSMFLGLVQVAIYNNYYLIMSAVMGVLSIVSTAILAGVGNSLVTETQEKNYNDMKKINFIYMWIAGWCTVCLLCLYQPFTRIFFGVGMMFPMSTMILFCVYFYALKMLDILGVYGGARGLWWEGRYRALFEGLANLLLNFLLGKYFGVYGIVIGTIVSAFIFSFFWGTEIVFQYYFTEEKSTEYYLLNLLYFMITGINCGVTYLACSIIRDENIFGFMIKLIICVFVPNVIYYILYRKTVLYKISWRWLGNILHLNKTPWLRGNG
jgi:O-antigen/teichoic acid export membrane protein